MSADVTGLVKDILNSEEGNNGFEMRLQTEQKYRSVRYASTQHNDANRWPKRAVTYTQINEAYYLKDHLGNIRVTLDGNGNGNVVTIPKRMLASRLAYRDEILQDFTDDYYPFGLSERSGDPEASGQMPGRSYNIAMTGNQYKFSGKELDEEGGLDWYYFGARYYDPAIGRWGSVDPLAGKYLSISPYNYVYNNPINAFDPNGQYIVSVHYKITHDIMSNLGYTQNISDLVGHYASVYADNPGIILLALNNIAAVAIGYPTMLYRDNIDYSSTSNSQNTYTSYASTGHAMTADWETLSSQEAMNRGLAFGWEKIFLSTMSGNIEDMKANSKGLERLGQGIHALQDAFAHEGIKMEDHDLKNDIFGNQTAARSITRSAILVHQILRGNFKNISGTTTLDMRGASQSQIDEVTKRLEDAGYTVNIQ